MAKKNKTSTYSARFGLALIIMALLFSFCDVKSQDDCYNDVGDKQIGSVVENSIFADPNHPDILLNANNGSNGVDIFISKDWGEHWSLAHTFFGGPDPSAAIDLDGRFYVTHLRVPQAGTPEVTFSDDGTNWSDGILIAQMGADQPYLWVDNGCSSTYKDRLYCSWSSPGGQPPLNTLIYLSYSIDRGENWTSPILINQAQEQIWLSGSNIKTDAQGNIYITWHVGMTPEEWFWNKLDYKKSTDGGNTWTHNDTQFPYAIGGRSAVCDQGVGGGQSAMAINQQTGEIFILWSSPVSGSPYHIYFIKSADGGNRWSTAPILINQDMTKDNR